MGAILFIVFSHFDHECFQYFLGFAMSDIYLSKGGKLGWLMYGWTGKAALALLCVISGFLTAMRYSGQKEYDGGFFVITRYLRLMLPVAGTNLLFGIVFLFKGIEISVPDYIRSAVVPGMNNVNRNLWCIGSFLVGNLLVYLLCYLQSKGKKMIWLYPLLLVLLMAIQSPWTLAVVAGGGGFLLAERLQEKGFVKGWMLVLIAPFFWWLLRGEESTLLYYRDILAGVLLLVTIYCMKPLQRLFAGKVWKPLKKCSYSLFVVHGMTLFLLGATWQLVQMLGISSPKGIFVVLFLLTFGIDLVAAGVIYYLFEVKIYWWAVSLLLSDRNTVKKEMRNE